MNRSEIASIVRDVIARQAGSSQHTPSAPAAQTASTQAQRGRVAMLEAKETLRLREFPLRQIRSDEILVKVEGCGICGTDIHCYKNDPFKLTPNVLGHEGTGTVLEVGSDIEMDSTGKPVHAGDKIVTSLFQTTNACLIPKYNPLKANLCDDMRIYGLLPDTEEDHFNGYFGEYLIIRPESSCFVVNDMSLELRVLIEPAAVVCHALDRAKNCGRILNFRSRVIVQGCGPIGLMMVAVLKTFGINNIIAIDGNASRLEMAIRMGADHVLNYKGFTGIDELVLAINELTKGLGAHFAFQVTGFPQAFSNLFKCIRRGGGLCEVGHFVDAGSSPINPHEDICKKELTVVGSWAYNSFEYPNAYHFLQRAAGIGIPITDLITHRFALDQIQQAFDTSLRQEGIKILVTP
jgi:L-iditol 2-dehydrogenase